MRPRRANVIVPVLLLASSAARAAVLVVTTTADARPGSLRAAIAQANATPEADTIGFTSALAGKVIAPRAALPPLTGGGIALDADLNADGRPDVRLDGAACGGNALEIRSRGNVIRGLAITHFDCGVALLGPNAAGNTVAGCYLGTNLTGTYALGNGVGVQVSDGASGNTIGGTATRDRNVISGNHWPGIFIANAARNVVAGNFIGVDATGRSPIPNGAGVALVDAERCRVGSGTPGGGNVISGSRWRQGGLGPLADQAQAADPTTGLYGCGVLVLRGGKHSIAGNRVGTDASGQSALGNAWAAVDLIGATEVLVGGTSPEQRNVISASRRLPGVYVDSCRSVTVQGNYVGLNAAGTGALANGYGIYVLDSAEALIGGRAPGARNVVGGNLSTSIWVHGGSGNRVWGNYLGLVADGRRPLGNLHGIYVDGDAVGTSIGTPGAGNVIGNEGGSGISVSGSASQTVIRSNVIGSDPTGTLAMPIRTDPTSTSDWACAIRVFGDETVVGGPGAGNRLFSAPDGIGLWWQSEGGGAIEENVVRPAPGQRGIGNTGICLMEPDKPQTARPPRVKGNTVARFYRALEIYPYGCPVVVTGNRFEDSWYGVFVWEGAQADLGDIGNADLRDDGGNRFRRLTERAVENRSRADIKAQNNDWGTADPKAIAALIFDGRYWPDFGRVEFMPLMSPRATPSATRAQVTGLTAAPSGPGMEVVFALSARASVTVEVLNVAGRPVAILAPRDCGAGLCRLSWDGRTTLGSPAPAGAYLLRVAARAETGEIASAMAAAALRR